MISPAWENVMPNLRDQHFGLNLNYSLGSATKPTHLVEDVMDDVSTTSMELAPKGDNWTCNYPDVRKMQDS